MSGVATVAKKKARSEDDPKLDTTLRVSKGYRDKLALIAEGQGMTPGALVEAHMAAWVDQRYPAAARAEMERLNRLAVEIEQAQQAKRAGK